MCDDARNGIKEFSLTREFQKELFEFQQNAVKIAAHHLNNEKRGGAMIGDVERLFEFFDKWRWHLDTRISASGKDINPDVLGYIFEQYINDRAKMGAYYTKEDITEYIGRNCILPFLFDKVSKSSQEMEKVFAPDGMVWRHLQTSGERYVFDAVKHGYSPDWRSHIPANIAKGLDTSASGLLERRADWNNVTANSDGGSAFALPTEIWRETIERLQRCESVVGKIASGGITQINDFITYNLDIRSFAQDLLANTDNHRFVGKFYHALQEVTILDPTCGSGAFLFAAMNILEPLYEICIDRMQAFNKKNPLLFKNELAEIDSKYRSNIQYFIYKSIILRNLHGVDIMGEAVEIAKLRLFLKMVAVVEVNRRAPNLGLDPLPDIDFNIRCGNTLVGYATEEEIINGSNADLFTRVQFQEKIRTEMQKVALAYDTFRHIQLTQPENISTFKEAKSQLRSRLDAFTAILNRQMFSHASASNYNKWLSSHQPFHWVAEFYQIIHGNGGFDVIIGNPPYVEYNKKDKKTGIAISDVYKLSGYSTMACGNLYAYCIERISGICSCTSRRGVIIPISAVTTPRMASLVKIVKKGIWASFYDFRPGKLFDGVNIRLCIIINDTVSKNCHTTKYKRWYSENRASIFTNMAYHPSNPCDEPIISKCSNHLEYSIFKKIYGWNYLQYNGGNKTNTLYYHDAILYWLRATDFEPSFEGYLSSHVKKVYFKDKQDLTAALALFNSTFFYWFWTSLSNCRDLSFEILYKMRPFCTCSKDNKTLQCLMRDFLSNAKIKERNQKQTGLVRYKEFYPSLSKKIINEIDKVLAINYGINDEELDYIINYDIKYRMGEALNGDE